jgi:hypothetical protein
MVKSNIIIIPSMVNWQKQKHPIVGMEGDKNDRPKGIYAHFKSLNIHIK